MRDGYNILIAFSFIFIIGLIGFLVYIYDTNYKPVMINNSINDTIPSEKYVDSPTRELPFTVQTTYRLNNTHICYNKKNIYTCELYEDYKGNIPFDYAKIKSYEVKFINEEVYIINENHKTNPSISSITIQPY